MSEFDQIGNHHAPQKVRHELEDRVAKNGNQTLIRLEGMVGDAASTLKEHPYAAVAVVAGLAFAVGALWKLRPRSQHTQLEHLMAHLPDQMTAKHLRSYWR